MSDVHVLVTTESTGGGGTSWTMKFIGVGRWQGQDRTLTFSTPTTATSDERRREVARVFKLGLVGYAGDSSAFRDLDVSYRRPSAAAVAAAAAKDPWNFWVFRVNFGGNAFGESRNSSRSARASFSASRTTEQWKINFNGNRNSNRDSFDLGDGQTVKTRRQSWNFSNLTVRSLGPHWSVGFRGSASHSSFSNTDRSLAFSPGLEWDFFPYSESSRRSLTVQYNVGVTHFNYRDLTIFDKLEETVPKHDVTMSLGLREPWGSLNGFATFSQHLNNRDRIRASVFGGADWRVFKGFSVNFHAGYEKIKDQIALVKGSASTEEILLRLRQLDTNHSYQFNIGVSYSFGSIFNSVVNPRFGGGGERIFFFF